MAELVFGGKHVAITGFGDCVLTYDVDSGKKTRLQMPKSEPESKDLKGCDDGSDQILATAFSPSGKYFAASDDHKALTLWHAAESWELLSSRFLPRRATAVTFDSAELNILVADKSGDVHCFPICFEDGKEKGDSLAMGHVSMLLDLKMCGNDKFLVTCDRDEKIRVSHYPNAYNIQAFCLGHSDFVSRLLYLDDVDLIASGSGDGTVALWNYRKGIQLCSIDCAVFLDNIPLRNEVPSDSSVHAIQLRKCKSTSAAETCCRGVDIKCLAYCEKLKVIAVAFEGLSVLLVFKIQLNDDKMQLSLASRITTSGVVWGICFDGCQHLLTLQNSEGGLFMIYTLQETDHNLQITQLSYDDSCAGLFEIMKQVNQEGEFFKSASTVPSKYPALHKVRIDNMKEYISRKQERLHHEQEAKNRKTNLSSTTVNDKSLSDGESKEENKISKKIRLIKDGTN